MIASRPLSHRISIKNNLELGSRHPMPEKALMIFRFRAAVEASYRIVLSIGSKPNKRPGIILLIPEVLAFE